MGLPSLAVLRRVLGQPMSAKLFPAPGKKKVTFGKLATSKARDLAQALPALPYVRLLECRTGGDPTVDYLIVELEVELPQFPVNDIRKFETCAIAFPSAPDASPDILALREDFPQVPHLNLREQEFPKSLCVYEDAFAETGFKWSPVRFIEDVRTWLARTARGDLHQPGQPLEPLMEAGAPELIVPNGLLKDVKSGEYLFLRHGMFAGNTNTILVLERVTSPASASMFAVYLVGNVQTHGLIRKRPGNLADLQDFLKTAGIDVIAACQEAMRQYLDLGGRTGEQTIMTVLVDLPKARHKGEPEEWRDRLAFITHEAVDELSTLLGVSAKHGNSVGRLIGAAGSVDPAKISVVPFRRLETLSPELAAQFNGTPGNASPMLLVGVGALGSQIFVNLLRAGFGRWTLLDRDLHLPHNAARHALPGLIGEFKAMAMANLAKAILPGDQTEFIVADLLDSRSDQEAIDAAIKKSEAIVDCSATVAVARKLAKNDEGGRRVSIFLSPSGRDLVLLGESKARKIRLDQLEMMYYRALWRDKNMVGHLFRAGAPLRYANACRDRSVILPQDLVAMHSGIASSAIKKFLANEEPQITVWRSDMDSNVGRFDIPISSPMVSTNSGWRIVTDDFLFLQLRLWRAERLPNETGGILFGSFDMEQKIIYVVDGLPSPSNSTEWPTVYIRGTAGLTKSRTEVDSVTQGGLEYVGEWHSHPDGYNAEPSKDDMAALKTLSGVMAEDARPAVMFIIAKKDMRILIG